MDNLPPKDRFLQSLDRCTRDEAFIPTFYDRFLSASDDIRDKFQHTNFDQQNKMLLRSLRLAAGATAGEPASLRELRERAKTHNRHHLNIKPELYEFWLDAVIETAQEFDDQWDSNVSSAWHTILGYVVNHMIAHY